MPISTKELQDLGLSKNESSVYSALIHNGVSGATTLLKLTRIGNSQLYTNIQKLIEKGLVQYALYNNRKKYIALPPNQQILTLQSNMDSAVKTKETIEKILENGQSQNLEQNIELFEGQYGIKLAFKKHQSLIISGDDICVIGYSFRALQSPMFRFLVDNDNELVSLREKSKIKIIIDENITNQFKSERTYQKKLYTIRLLPSQYFGPMAINISRNSVMLTTLGDRPTATIFYNPATIESFRSQFSLLWKVAQKP